MNGIFTEATLPLAISTTWVHPSTCSEADTKGNADIGK